MQRLGLELQGVQVEMSGKDPIVLLRLPGGGGLLSYCKEKESEQLYVHTLNTESGFIRKVDALRLDPEMLEDEAAAACAKVLPFLLDSEKRPRR